MGACGSPRLRVLALGLVGGLLLGAPCAPFNTISITTPLVSAVIDDPAVSVAARVATSFDPLSVEVRVDGVDLVAALGLAPPFSGVSGMVSIGGSPVQVSEFTYDTSVAGNPKVVTALLAGLPEGPHVLEVSGIRTATGQPVADTHPFVVSSPLAVALDAVPAGASGSQTLAGGSLAYGTVGAPLSGPPVGLAGGGSLRPGFVPAAEARIADAP